MTGRAGMRFAIAASSLLVLVGLARGAVGAGVAGGGQVSDPAGDAKGGADVTRLTVGVSTHLKASTGTSVDVFSFEYTVAHLKASPATGAYEREVLTSLDTNRDLHADYFVSFGVRGPDGDPFVGIFKAAQLWKQTIPKSSTMSYAYSRDHRTHTVEFGPADIGGAKGFDILVSTIAWDREENPTAQDRVPDVGWISYTMGARAQFVKSLIGTPTMSPPAPVAGKPFSLVLPLVRSDTGAPAPPSGIGVASCETSVGGVAVPCTSQFANAIERIRLTIPPGTEGKTLKVHVTIRLETRTLDKTISLRVA